MAIRKISETIEYTAEEVTLISSLMKNPKGAWKKKTKKAIALRAKIRKALQRAHKSEVIEIGAESNDYIECAYCGLWVGGTGRGEIEHIAYQSEYGEFVFHRTNLVYICSHCNGSSKKGQNDIVKNWEEIKEDVNLMRTDIIEHLSEIYSRLEFEIVHPKIDNPENHYEWLNSKKIILKKGLTEKGNNSIQLFELKNLMMTESRSMQKQKEKEYLENPENFIKIYNAIKNDIY